jgi:CheY-like chemotaxis protein/GAF domain-containing protein
VSDRLRILVLGDSGLSRLGWLRECRPDAEYVPTASLKEALDRLARERFDAVLTDPADRDILEAVRHLLQSERILAAVPDGLALVNFDLKIVWANPTFEAWCGGSPVGRGFYEALGSPAVVGPEYCPFHTALAAREALRLPPRAPGGASAAPTAVSTRLVCRGNRHLDLHVMPLAEPTARGPLLIALGRDVTAVVEQQQKLDALHKAGRELAALAPDQLADMSVAERIELLKSNIRRFTRDLLHYDVIEIRLLDRQTGRLEPLLQEGMVPEAAGRALTPATEGQGVTGYVAAVGKGYLCPDTRNDPHYLTGAPGARSSLTVPLIYQDQVIGTFNVESPEANHFTEDDLQFAEIFSHEIAEALHTLDLLSAEKGATATQSIDAVNREVALPVDEILTAAASVLERYIGHEPEIADKLRKILAAARSIKQSIQKVGEDLAPKAAPATAPSGSVPKLAPPPNTKGLRVLVADDDERVRRTAHGLLGRWGCVVETARDGKEALTMARLGAYDAILADIRLPDVPGYEAYRRLREAQPQARVILMTAYGYDPSHTLVKARQDGLKHVLFKPFRVDQLLNALTFEGAGARGQRSEVSRKAGNDQPTPANMSDL